MRINGFADPENAGWGGPRAGLPTWQNFGNALGVWVAAQDRRVTVREAAAAFNVDVPLIKAALDHHPWLCMIDEEAIGPDYLLK